MRAGLRWLGRLRLAPVAIATAILLLGYCLQMSKGLYAEAAMNFLLGVYGCLAIALVWSAAQRPATGNALLASLLSMGGLVLFIYELADQAPVAYASSSASDLFHRAFLPLLALCAAATAVVPAAIARGAIVAMAIVFTSAGVFLLRASPAPFIDVHRVTKDSCEAAASGVDPYSITFPDIYADGTGNEQSLYPPGMIVNGRIRFGYQYTPLSFAVAFAGYLAGDFRYGNLLAIALAAILIACATPHRISSLAAALLLLMPRTFFVAEMGWSEPAVVLCAGLVLFCALRRPGLLPYAVGLMLVSKQHLILILPIVLLLVPQPWTLKRITFFALKALAAGAVVSLPLILWNVHAFWHSAVEVQLKNPFRRDSLNFAAWWLIHYQQQAPSIVSFVLAGLAGAFCLWRSPRNPAGFAFSAAIVYLAFFAFAKQAFCNYYFMIIGFMCAALAAWGVSADRSETA